MIIRTIIYLAISMFFIWDIKKDKKPFKKYIFLIIAITYFAGSPYFLQIDDRIQLTTRIIAALITAFYLSSYYKDFKVEKFREKKRQRDLRDQQRQADNQILLENMLKAKNQGRENNSRSYEITLDMPRTVAQIKGQTSFFKDYKEARHIESYDSIQEQEEEKKTQVLENQLDIFNLD
ncbi:MAG: hypothetical protein Q4E36_02730 [Bacillota bacterium]|nr:hypothetical protein [Bacillota bacterium]